MSTLKPGVWYVVRKANSWYSGQYVLGLKPYIDLSWSRHSIVGIGFHCMEGKSEEKSDTLWFSNDLDVFELEEL